VPLLPDLRTRHRVPEWMDDPTLDPAEHRRALRGLSRLNTVSGAFRSLWHPIAELATTHRSRRISAEVGAKGQASRFADRSGRL
jgi:hypothetical protein